MRFVFSHMVLGVCSSNSLGMFFLGDNINRWSLTWWCGAEICLKNFWDLVKDFRTAYRILHRQFEAEICNISVVVLTQLFMFVLLSRVFFVATIFIHFPFSFLLQSKRSHPKRLISFILLRIWETHVYGLKSQTITNRAFWSIFLVRWLLSASTCHLFTSTGGLSQRISIPLASDDSDSRPRVVDRCCRVEVTSNAFFFP